MTRTFSLFFTGCLIFLATSAHADKNVLQQGEFALRSYTLSIGIPVANNPAAPILANSFNSLTISPAAMQTVLSAGTESYNCQPVITSNSLKGFAINLTYAPTSNITLHSYLGFTEAIDQQQKGYSDSMSWEINLGVAYQFFDNFAYEIHFGYMDTGDLYKDSAKFMDLEEITIVTNKLTMSF